jgi:pectate lyase
VFNNYCRNASYCIVSAMNAGLVVENNVFDTVNNPGRVDFSGDLGRLVARGNVLIKTHHPIETRGSVVEPGTYYPYTLDPAADVPALVSAGAGVGPLS